MARSISDIKNELTREWMNNKAVADCYGFKPGETFSKRFGAASIENMLFYIFAVGAWTLEKLFDLHREEVTAQVDATIPHRPQWYRNKALAFIPNRELLPDSDSYGLNEEEAEAERVVRHAVAIESRDSSVLIIKVAGGQEGERAPINPDEQTKLERYLNEIKDAGVRISVINEAPERFNCTVDVYYNPLLAPEFVAAKCKSAITNYIENLPFNGEYSNMALIDCLQAIEGVRIAEMQSSQAGNIQINARYTPKAGYMRADIITLNMKDYHGE